MVLQGHIFLTFVLGLEFSLFQQECLVILRDFFQKENKTSTNWCSQNNRNNKISMINTTGDTHNDTAKKRPRSEVHTKDEVISKKKKKKKYQRDNDDSSYAVEISNASSAAMLPLISSSIYSISDGIPRRELKLIVSEARTCEDALEREIKLLREALLIEKQKRKPKTIDAAAGNSKEANDTNTNTDNSVIAKKPDDDTASSAYIIPTTASTDKGGTKKNTEEKGIVTSASAIAVTKSLITDDSNRTMTQTKFAALKTMIESEITPPDTHWTISALLGRLRHELTTPLPPSSQLPAYREKAGLQQLVNSVGLSYSCKKKRATNMTTSATTSTIALTESTAATSTVGNSTNGTFEVSQFKRLSLLPDHLEFFREHATPDKLLALWKKLSTHRSSLVFRRPVNPKEAPGYSDRIRFPMDLSLVRKLIVSRNIKNYHGILQRVHLIGHNCVKYNGRESDYALVTREFESVATEYIFTAVTAGCNYKGGSRTTSPVLPLAPSTSCSVTIITNSVVKDSLAIGSDTR